jgi:uncharacterized protein (DUF2147 family)
MPSIRLTTALAVVLTAFTFATAQAAAPLGTWLTEKGDAHIRIAPCGQAVCGTIVWLKDKVDPKTGMPPVDSSDPDPRKRHRPILGLRIFAMSYHKHGGWYGPIYNSDDGQTYNGRLIPHGATLEVTGCAGIMCGGETWHRIGN